MKTSNRFLQVLALMISLGVLGACGGGGGAGGAGTPTFTLGGSVSGLSGTVVLQNNGGDNRSVSVDGSFTFAAGLAESASYSVTVLTQPAGQTCSVTNGAGTVSGANVTNVSVICAAGAFTVGGTVSGLNGTVVLRNNGGNDLTLSADGAFTFSAPLADGSGYTVSVFTQPAGQGCSVANGTGAIAGANVTNVAITCAAGALTIGGTVSGLSGTVVLQNNGGDNLTRSVNGSFTFATALADLSAYDVSVLTQPSGQSCSVANGAGTLSGSHVTNVSVACANTAGYVVAARENPVEINIYRADQPNVPIETIAGATFIGPMYEGSDNVTTDQSKRRRLGIVYGKLAAPGIYFELGVFLQSQRVVLAAAGGHTYKYLGLIDGATRRAVFLDTVGANVGVRTATLDGVEDHLVKSGCLSVTLPAFSVGAAFVFSAAGVAFLCEETAGVRKVYYSDGVAPAVYMGSDLRVPMALTATHLITADVFNQFLPQLRTQPLAGALSGSVQLDANLITPSTLFGGMDGGAETLMAINPQGIVLGHSFKMGDAQPYEAWTVNADLSVGGNTFMRSRSLGPPLFGELSPDGSKASLVYKYMAGATFPDRGAVIDLALPTMLLLTVVPATDAAMDVRFLSGGKISAGWGPQSGGPQNGPYPTSLNVYNADGSVFSGVSALIGSTFVATKDNYLLYSGGNPQGFYSSLFDATADLILSPTAQQPRPTLRSDGIVTFVDDAGFPWIASADPSIPVALRLKQKIDDVPTIFVENVGDGSGNRVFLTLHRTSGDKDVVMFNLNNRTTTPIVSGATADTGYFFPN